MSPEDIKKLIDLLPDIFMYIVPGYIFIKVHNYIVNSKTKEIKNYIMEYIITSFIINIIFEYILKAINILCKTNYDMKRSGDKLIICIATIFISYIVSMIFISEWWTGLMNKIGINRSNSSNILSEINDTQYGTYIRAFLSNEKIIYDGYLIKFHCDKSYSDSFFILQNYIVYDYGKNDNYKYMYQSDDDK